MAPIERRVKDLEKKIGWFPTTGRTVSQRLAAERCAILLIRGKTVPKTLQRQAKRLPVEEVSPAIQRMIDAVSERVNGNGKKERS